LDRGDAEDVAKDEAVDLAFNVPFFRLLQYQRDVNYAFRTAAPVYLTAGKFLN
jgi:hypothetical protein